MDVGLQQESFDLLGKIYEEQSKTAPDMTTLRASRLKWDLKRFGNAVEILRKKGLIKNVCFSGINYFDTSLDEAVITQLGIDNLKNIGII